MSDENTQPEEILEAEQLKQDLENMTEMAKRTMADMQNLKRRMEEDRRQIITMANASLISSLLPIIDNFSRALAHMPAEQSDWLKGVEMSINQLQKTLEDSGLKKIEALNSPFDPNLHEALVQGPGEKDVVIEELETGYILGDKVLRHSKVKVGNGE